jgi:CopG antitoxin of type II toxin-antitoxin system
MKRTKSSISKATSYAEMGAYWDEHDLSDAWDSTSEAGFEFIAEPQITYFAIERDLSEKIRSLASSRGVSADTLLNMWVQEKLVKEQRVA